VKPALFQYLRPSTVDEAVGLLADHGDDAKILAGGQSLLPLLNLRLAVPSVLVDISGLPELRETRVTGSGATRYGACVVHSEIEDGVVPDRSAGLMCAAAAGIGYRAIRNRGTLGGSLAHSDGSAEWPVIMAALDAEVVARSTRGERALSCREFVQGFFTNALAEDELIVGVDVPPSNSATRWGLYKAARKPGEFADSLAVAVVEVDDEGVVCNAVVWLGAARDVPVRLSAVEDALRGRRPGDMPRSEVGGLVAEQCGSGTDGPSRYAAHLHGVAVGRALAQLRAEGER
jgi:carbon-monoxide dehydrogenase medium subunit